MLKLEPRTAATGSIGIAGERTPAGRVRSRRHIGGKRILQRVGIAGAITQGNRIGRAFLVRTDKVVRLTRS